LISEELEELLALADRILVMYEGQVTAAVERPSAADVDGIGLHMMGGEGAESAGDTASAIGSGAGPQ
jgi:simple sugar transport system ATP-binding protein